MSFFKRFKNKSSNTDAKNHAPSKNIRDAVIYVDYEHWFIGFEKLYHCKPDIVSWFESIKQNYNVKDIYFFANFSKFEHKEEEVKKIRVITNKIIDTFNPDLVSQKDYTDFIILDNVYQSVLSGREYDTYILFTGDGHFQSVTAYLKNMCNKEVGIYAVKGAINKNLSQAATWLKEVSPKTEEKNKVYPLLFNSFYQLYHSENPAITVNKTVQYISYKHKIPKKEVYNAIDELIVKGYLKKIRKELSDDKKREKDKNKKITVDFIEVNWLKVYDDNLWSKDSSVN